MSEAIKGGGVQMGRLSWGGGKLGASGGGGKLGLNVGQQAQHIFKSEKY